MKHYNIPIFLPESACPFRCVYCNQYSIAGQHTQTSVDEVKRIIERNLGSFTEKERYVEVAFFGGNFTGLPEDLQLSYMESVKPYLESGQVQSVRCSTRPDYIKREHLRRLKEGGMLHIELGAQSTDDTVLKACGRGHDFNAIRTASQIILDEGFVLGLQMMTGLPEDSFEISMKTAADIVSLGASETRIYPCVVVKHTKLEQMFRNGTYTPLSLDEAVDRCAELYTFFNNHNVNVLRMGLHPSDDLNGEACIAGPYHVNFAEMVFGRIWQKRFNGIDIPDKDIVIEVNTEQVNHAFGWKSGNRKSLLERYRSVRITGNASLRKDEWTVASATPSPRVIIADSRMPEEAKHKLETYGEVLWLEPTENVYPSICAHPDIFFFVSNDKVVVAPNVPRHWIDKLNEKGISFIKGASEVGSDHPETTHYNAVGVDDMLIHNTKYTDREITALFAEKIHVNQSYTRCNLIALDGHRFITSDRGIYNTLKNNDNSIFFVEPTVVVLAGHKNGFFPGCCGLFGNTLFVCGGLDRIEEGKRLRKWLAKSKISVVELYDGPLYDVGGIMFL